MLKHYLSLMMHEKKNQLHQKSLSILDQDLFSEDSDFFSFHVIEKKKEKCLNNSLYMKFFAFLMLIAFVIEDSKKSNHSFFIWIIFVIINFILFFADIYYLKQAKKQEWILYHKRVENLKKKQNKTKINKTLPDNYKETHVLINEPTETINIPFIPYFILFIIYIILLK